MRLVVVGFGDARAELEAQAPPGVVFTGAMDHAQLQRLVPLADAVVVPSVLPEAFGMVAAEAAACGVVPIVSDHSGLAEVAAGLGEAGITFDGTAADLAVRLDALLELPAAERRRLGAARARGGGGAVELGADRAAPARRGSRERPDAPIGALVNASATRGLRRLPAPLRRRRGDFAADPFRTLWEAAFEPLVAHVDGRIVDVNPAFRATFGYTVEEALRLTVADLAPAAERAVLAERIRVGGNDPFELIGVTKSGDSRYLEATARSIVQDGEERELLALRDVTDRRVAEEEAGVLAFQYAADLTVVAEVARRLPRTADATSARLAICEAALEVCDGAMAVLMEPDGSGNLVSTAMAGAHCQPLLVPIDHSSSATAQVFNSREPFFADLSTHGGVSPQLVEATGLVTALWQPVLRDGDPVGVLLVAWDRHVTLISDRAAAVVGLFAAEAAVAVERVDILARLDELNTALAQQVEALRLSDQFKSDFVSSVSHELRTPLASILGYTDILVNGEVGR